MSLRRCFRSLSRHRRSRCSDARRSVGRQRAHVRLTVQNCRDRVGNRFAAERRLRRQHLVEHDAERPDVGPFVHRLSSRPVRRLMYAAVPEMTPASVGCAPGVGGFVASRLARLVGSRAFARPEVQQLHRAVLAHLDVRGLQVSMDDPLFVRGFERLRQSASAIEQRLGQSESGRAAIRSARSSPSTSSMTSAWTPWVLQSRRPRRCVDDSARRAHELRD